MSMDRSEYMRWWIRIDDEDIRLLPDLERTLALHVAALQDRIDSLPDDLRCCCAYDHPDDICMTHKRPEHPKPLVM